MGIEDGSIKDSQLSASSASSGLVAAKHGRLNGNGGYGAWCPLQDQRWYTNMNGGPYHDQYFEVRFLKPVRITAVGTQGRSKNFGNEGVENFLVDYSLTTSGNIVWKRFHEWMQPQPKVRIFKKYFVGGSVIKELRELEANIWKNDILMMIIHVNCRVNFI